MVRVESYESALKRRRMVASAGNGETHWRSDYMGQRGRANSEPESFLIEMTPNEVLLPHFHAVDQFQVFVDGAGVLGRQPIRSLTVHYADHHTGYGPIVAGSFGLSYFTFRPKTDPGAMYLNMPGYLDALKPSRKRHGTVENLVLSTKPVLASREELVVERLLQEIDADDGLRASLFRLGPEMKVAGSEPSKTGGQYYLIANGNLHLNSQDIPEWAIVFVSQIDMALELHAGSEGAEVLVLEFPLRINE